MRKGKKNSLGFSLIIALILVLIFSYSMLSEKDKVTDLKQNWILSRAEIDGIVECGKGVVCTQYSYKVNNRKYIDVYSPYVRQIGARINDFRQGEWSVIYDSTNYENSALLLTKEDFIKMGIPYNNQNVVVFDN
ncbi:MAG: hypothetical protein KDC11_00940 [Chitinophagaceae bacterium]|nr:hypothetical protein [Chitinophagaceae bacterium]